MTVVQHTVGINRRITTSISKSIISFCQYNAWWVHTKERLTITHRNNAWRFKQFHEETVNSEVQWLYRSLVTNAHTSRACNRIGIHLGNNNWTTTSSEANRPTLPKMPLVARWKERLALSIEHLNVLDRVTRRDNEFRQPKTARFRHT